MGLFDALMYKINRSMNRGKNEQGTTRGEGSRFSANPGPLGAGDVTAPEHYDPPYLTPTGPGTGISRDAYAAPITQAFQPLGARALGIDNFDTVPYGRAVEGEFENIRNDPSREFSMSFGDADFENALREAMIEAARGMMTREMQYRENDQNFDKMVRNKRRTGSGNGPAYTHTADMPKKGYKR